MPLPVSPDDHDQDAQKDPGPAPSKLPIVFANPSEPFTPKELIVELLRTRYCVPGSIFLVEDVTIAPLPRSMRWRAIRLVLGDGDLCIQALLRPEMHRFVDVRAVHIGCYVRLGTFHIQHKEIESGESGGAVQMVYLVIEDLATVGWHSQLSQVSPAAKQVEQARRHYRAAVDDEDENEQEEDLIPSSQLEFEGIDAALEQAERPSRQATPTKHRPRQWPSNNYDDDDELDADDFENMVVSPSKTARRREEAAAYAHRGPVALARDWTHPSIPLKLTRLRSIPDLPYKQNWSINALVVVSALDDVQPCPVPPYAMRTARVADPSTGKRVLLTVFLDPDEFAPQVGAVVLLIGVKNHLFEGGSLKKYVSDKPRRPGERWWYEEPRQFAWCDVDGMRSWWETEGKTEQGDEIDPG